MIIKKGKGRRKRNNGARKLEDRESDTEMKEGLKRRKRQK